MNPAFDYVPIIGEGLCGCGCGLPRPKKVEATHRLGHRSRHEGPYYKAEDCGYIGTDMMPSPCHLWLLCKTEGGYGMAWDASIRTSRPAHIISWERANNRRVSMGWQVHHLCENPGCVNPVHLKLVTVAVNMRYRSTTKLTHEEVLAIRTEAESIVNSHQMIADRHGVSRSTVTCIVNNRTWKGI